MFAAGTMLLLIALLLLSGCGNGYYRGPVSEHFDGSKFDNPWEPMPNRFSDFLKWRLTAERGDWPEHVEVEPTLPPARVVGRSCG